MAVFRMSAAKRIGRAVRQLEVNPLFPAPIPRQPSAPSQAALGLVTTVNTATSGSTLGMGAFTFAVVDPATGVVAASANTATFPYFTISTTFSPTVGALIGVTFRSGVWVVDLVSC